MGKKKAPVKIPQFEGGIRDELYCLLTEDPSIGIMDGQLKVRCRRGAAARGGNIKQCPRREEDE